MLVGTTAWFFVSGDKASELHRLDRLVAVLLTAHALRNAGHTVKRITLFQIITGLILEIDITTWMASPSASELLTSFIQARVMHAHG